MKKYNQKTGLLSERKFDESGANDHIIVPDDWSEDYQMLAIAIGNNMKPKELGFVELIFKNYFTQADYIVIFATMVTTFSKNDRQNIVFLVGKISHAVQIFGQKNYTFAVPKQFKFNF